MVRADGHEQYGVSADSQRRLLEIGRAEMSMSGEERGSGGAHSPLCSPSGGKGTPMPRIVRIFADQKKVWQNHFAAESFRSSCVDRVSPRKIARSEGDRKIGNGKTNSVHPSVLSRFGFEPTRSGEFFLTTFGRRNDSAAK
jgi:hypothetical protein